MQTDPWWRRIWQRVPKSVLVLVVLLILLNAALLSYPPEKLVQVLSVENSYLVVFLIAALGGLSSLTSATLYSAIATFAAGGALPWLLGIVGGIGIAIGDALIFSLFAYGYSSVKERYREAAERYRTHLDRLPRWLQYFLLFLILGVSPFPNDIIMALLVVLGFRLRAVAPLLVLSGISIATITAYTGSTLLEMLAP